jgi:hypothetical protein
MGDFQECFSGLSETMKAQILVYAQDIQRQLRPNGPRITTLADLEGNDAVIDCLLSTEYFGWPGSLSWCIGDHGKKVRAALYSAKNYRANQARVEKRRQYEAVGPALKLLGGSGADAADLLEQIGDALSAESAVREQQNDDGEEEYPF